MRQGSRFQGENTMGWLHGFWFPWCGRAAHGGGAAATLTRLRRWLEVGDEAEPAKLGHKGELGQLPTRLA
jgi:hypothetical protein